MTTSPERTRMTARSKLAVLPETVIATFPAGAGADVGVGGGVAGSGAVGVAGAAAAEEALAETDG